MNVQHMGSPPPQCPMGACTRAGIITHTEMEPMPWALLGVRQPLSPLLDCSSLSWYVLVAKLCPTLCDPMDCGLPGSSVNGTLQARILEWVAIPFSRGSSWLRDWTWISCTAGRFFTVWLSLRVSQMVHSRAVFSGRATGGTCLTSAATLGAFLEDGVTPRSLTESQSAELWQPI